MNPAPAARRRRQAGFALLIVLWTLPMLGLLAGSVLRAGHVDATLAANLRASATIEAAADGAVFEAAWRLFGGAWQADGVVRILRVGGAEARVRIDNDGGKINPNIAPVPELRDLLLQVGAGPAQANALADAMTDWRLPGETKSPAGAKSAEYAAAGLRYGPTGLPFRSLDEIGLVFGMTPALLDRLRPHLSVFQEGGTDPALADEVVRRVLDDMRRQGVELPAAGISTGNLVVTIRAEVESSGARFARSAVARVVATPQDDAPPIEILTWERATD